MDKTGGAEMDKLADELWAIADKNEDPYLALARHVRKMVLRERIAAIQETRSHFVLTFKNKETFLLLDNVIAELRKELESLTI